MAEQDWLQYTRAVWDIQRIVKKGKYLYAVVPDHPHATRNEYVLHHRIVMENYLERILHQNLEVVHHKNKDTHDNRIDNLEVMTRSEHAALHMKDHPAKLIQLTCAECEKEFTRRANQRPEVKGYTRAFCSKRCSALASHRKPL